MLSTFPSKFRSKFYYLRGKVSNITLSKHGAEVSAPYELSKSYLTSPDKRKWAMVYQRCKLGKTCQDKTTKLYWWFELWWAFNLLPEHERSPAAPLATVWTVQGAPPHGIMENKTFLEGTLYRWILKIKQPCPNKASNFFSKDLNCRKKGLGLRFLKPFHTTLHTRFNLKEIGLTFTQNTVAYIGLWSFGLFFFLSLEEKHHMSEGAKPALYTTIRKHPLQSCNWDTTCSSLTPTHAYGKDVLLPCMQLAAHFWL